MEKKMFKSIMLLITYCLLLIVVIVKIDLFIGIINKGILIMIPIFIGIAIAFVLNRPYNFLLEKYMILFKKKKETKLIKSLALATVYILFIIILGGIIAFIIPQLVDSVQLLILNMGDYGKNLEKFANNSAKYLKLDSLDLSRLEESINKIPVIVGGFLTGLMPRIFDFTSNLVNAVINIVIGFILSVYLIADKDRLKRQFSKIIQAYLPLKFAEKFIKVVKITSKTFTKFVSGQITEAIILGSLCFLGMLLFGFEYSVLISILIGITSLVPIVGSIIGLIPSLFILLMIDPTHALWFLGFIILLQQLEGNLIYPKVVGGSIGLPPIWVMLAIIIGGGLFGVIGMLIGVPTASVMYQLLKDDTNKRIKVGIPK